VAWTHVCSDGEQGRFEVDDGAAHLLGSAAPSPTGEVATLEREIRRATGGIGRAKQWGAVSLQLVRVSATSAAWQVSSAAPWRAHPSPAKSATPELGCGAPVDGSPSRASIIGKASLLCFARPHPLVRSGQLHPTARRRPRRGGEEPTIRERGGGGRATTQRSKVRELASGRLNQNPTAGRKQVTWPYEVPSFG
jgi:hypothetical protein